MSSSLFPRAWRAFRDGQAAVAERLCREALIYDARDPSGLFLLGLIALQENRAADEVSPFEDVVHFKPDHADAHNNRCNATRDQRQLDEAEGYYERAIQCAPHYAEALNNLGIASILLRKQRKRPPVSRARSPDIQLCRGS